MPNTSVLASQAARPDTHLKYAIILASFVVLVFDHLLTFPSEVAYIWKKKKTPFSVLFLFNRYFALCVMSVYVDHYVDTYVDESCQGYVKMIFGSIVYTRPSYCEKAAYLTLAFTIITTLMAEAMVTLRAYAVYQNSRRILVLLCSGWVAHLILLLFAYLAPLGIDDHNGRNDVLSQASGLTPGLVRGVLFIAPAIIFDAIAGGLLTVGVYRRSTLYYTQAYMPLTRLVIRDGLLYFAVMFVSNVGWIVVHIYSCLVENAPLFDFTPMEIWSGCITTTMISRLTLNLRMYDPAANDELTFQTMSMNMSLKFQGARLNSMEDQMSFAEPESLNTPDI